MLAEDLERAMEREVEGQKTVEKQKESILELQKELKKAKAKYIRIQVEYKAQAQDKEAEMNGLRELIKKFRDGRGKIK